MGELAATLAPDLEKENDFALLFAVVGIALSVFISFPMGDKLFMN